MNIQMIAKDPVIRLWDLTERRVKQRFFGHHQGRFVVRSAFGGPREQFVPSELRFCPGRWWVGGEGGFLLDSQTLEGSFSAVSKPIFAITGL